MSWEVFDPRTMGRRRSRATPTPEPDNLNGQIKRAIRQALSSRGEKQKDLAARVGMSSPHLNTVITAERGLDVPPKLVEILDALGLELVIREKEGSRNR